MCRHGGGKQGGRNWEIETDIEIHTHTYTHTHTHTYTLCSFTHSGPTLCDPMDCSPPGSSVHGDSPDKNTEVDSQALLQGIFPTQELNSGLLHCRQILYHLGHQGSPWIYTATCKIESWQEPRVQHRKLSSVFCANLDGWDLQGLGGRPKRKGICIYTQLIQFIVWQQLTQHCKATIHQ